MTFQSHSLPFPKSYYHSHQIIFPILTKAINGIPFPPIYNHNVHDRTQNLKCMAIDHKTLTMIMIIEALRIPFPPIPAWKE